MDYKQYVGEKVIECGGKSGVISKVDDDGTIHIKFDGDIFDGGYMFDPFINGMVKFDKPELQEIVEKELVEIEKPYIELRDKVVTKNLDEAKYRITKDNEDGSLETVYLLKCDEEEARKVFSLVIHEQAKEYRRLKNKWRRICLFDYISGKQLAQES